MWGRMVVSLALCTAAAAALARAQHQETTGSVHGAPKRTLFTARARPEEVAGAGRRRGNATGTGAFIISADARSVEYQFTWDGLPTSQILAIDLHNFGAGAAGKSSVTELCGPNLPCRVVRGGGTISGTWAIPPDLVHELAAERIYVDVHTASEPEGALRGQILPLPWMVHSRQFVLRLSRPGEDGVNGTGTFYVTPFPQGTQLTFDLTVVGLPGDNVSVEVRRGKAATRLPVDGEAVRRRGGTISGTVKSGRGVTALPPALLDTIESGGAEVIVRAGRQVVASGRLVPVS